MKLHRAVGRIAMQLFQNNFKQGRFVKGDCDDFIVSYLTDMLHTVRMHLVWGASLKQVPPNGN